MNNFFKYLQIINEDIYSSKAMVYHRTSPLVGKTPEDFLERLFKTGFKINKERYNTHGSGLYSYIDLKSSNENSSYGEIIYKFQITSLDRFIFFNYEEFNKTYLKSIIQNKISEKNKNIDKLTKQGKEIKKEHIKNISYYNVNKIDNYTEYLDEDNFIYNQMIYFNFDKDINFKNYITNKNSDNQNNEATKLVNTFAKTIYRLIDGMVFDNILVCFNKKIIIPISYSSDDGKTWASVENIKKYKTRLIKRSQDYLNRKENETDNEHFIKKADISGNAKYIIAKPMENKAVNINRRVIWKKGAWFDGDWKYGTWEDGSFKNGVWRNGVWEGGEFGNKSGGISNNPIWIHGDWRFGIWRNGTWKSGTWDIGQFKKGIWENGTWRDGDFGTSTGVLNDAVWKDGTWEKGNFRNGNFMKGEWQKGNFFKGFFGISAEWKDGVFGKATQKNDQEAAKDIIFNGKIWEKGFWWTGTWKALKTAWKGGKWYGGFDSQGNWHEEGDSPDKW